MQPSKSHEETASRQMHHSTDIVNDTSRITTMWPRYRHDGC